jgi:hypothetical protein
MLKHCRTKRRHHTIDKDFTDTAAASAAAAALEEEEEVQSPSPQCDEH